MRTTKQRLLAPVLLAGLTLLPARSSLAASATWNGTTSTLWSLAGNWSASPAPGTGDTATFNNAGNANVSIDLGTGVTINKILFDTASVAAYKIGGTTAGAQTLTLDNSGSIVMTSTAGNGETINANLILGTATAGSYALTNSTTGKSITFAGAISGGTGGTAGAKTLTIFSANTGVNGTAFTVSGAISDGGATSLAVVKSGAGGAQFNTGVNTYSGGTTINAGWLNINNTTALGSGDVTVASGAGIQFAASPIANNISIAGTGPGGINAAIKYTATVVLNGTLSLTGNASIVTPNSTLNFTAGNVNLGAYTLSFIPVLQNNANNDLITLGSGTKIVSGTGGITFNAASLTTGLITLKLSGGNTYSGDTVFKVASGASGAGMATLALNHVNALQNSTLDTDVSSAFKKVTFSVAGNNTYNLGGLKGADDVVIDGNTINVGGNGQDTAYSGGISGTGGSLVKSGTGKLTLSGANTYSTSTTISNGTLALSGSGSIASALITNYSIFDVSGVTGGYPLASGQTLMGTGSITGSLTVNSGATLTVGGSTGTSGTGTMTVTGNLTLNGATVLRINKGGTSDKITAGTLILGGTITLNSVGAALAPGEQFPIFSAPNTGTPTIVGDPGNGLAWDSSRLNSEGIIAVVANVVPPAFVTALPANQSVECGSNATFTAAATGTSPLVYTWSINGTPIASGTNLTSFTTNGVHSGGSSYTVSVQVTNLVNSAVSSSTLTVQDTLKPVLTLVGTNELWTLEGQPFTDPGASAADACAGVITPTVSGAVNTSVPGDYLLTYTANDGNGNVDTATRTVHVQGIRSGVWTSAADGPWMTANNWSNGTVAFGPNSTADFSQVSLAASTTVHLDQPVSIGSLIFDDRSGTGQSWKLDNNGNAANVLTLASSNSSATITVSNSTTISAQLAGTNVLTKNGTGTLSLSTSNSYSGGTVVANGTLRLGSTSNSLLGAGPVTIASGARLLANVASLKALANDITLAGTGPDGSGAIYLGGQSLTLSNLSLSADATIGSDSGNTDVLTVNGTVDLGDNTLSLVCGTSTGTGLLSWHLKGRISGTGGLALSTPASPTTFFRLYLDTANTFSGETTISTVGTATATRFVLQDTNALQNSTYNTGEGGAKVATYFYVAGSNTYNFGGLKGAVDLALTTNSLNVGANGLSTTYSGKISGTGGLIKSGSGTLTLAGANTYTGSTTVNNGTLAVNGSIDGGAVTVVGNGTLGGYGQINGPVTVQSGGNLSLGTSTGNLTISNALTFQANSMLVMKLDRSSSPSNDRLNGITGMTVGGTLLVTNIGPALQGGETFTLFDADNQYGTFSATNLPALAPGLNWWTPDNFATLIVNRAPVASDMSLGAQSGEAQTLRVLGGKHAPTDADNDALTVTVYPAAHGITSTDGTSITYTAFSNYAGPDSFTYTVSDGRGGVATNTMTVNVTANGESLNRVSLVATNGGNVAITYAGIPGYRYALDTAGSLTLPIMWTPVVTNTAATNGLLDFQIQTTESQGFFRTRHVP